MKRKRGSKVVPVLRAAGLSLSLAGGGSAAAGAPVADALTHNSIVTHEITLGDEEIADVSLRHSMFSTKKTPDHRGSA